MKDFVTESKDSNDFKDRFQLLNMVKDIFKKLFLYKSQPKRIKSSLPRIKTLPDIRIKLPKMDLSPKIKMDLQRTWRKILEDEKKGVVRRKRYGPN